MSDPFRQVIDAEWKKTGQGSRGDLRDPPGVFWEYAISPPFPFRWPPDAGQRILYYLYATGHDPQHLADGVRISAPWGIMTVTGIKKSPPEFRRLMAGVREIGVQGVRPLQREEVLVYEQQEAFEPYLETLAGIPGENDKGARLLREYYTLWRSHNGVIAEELRKYHDPFFTWLGGR
jgi:hypothetical protein